jgi:large subunit ribosomal protein L30
MSRQVKIQQIRSVAGASEHQRKVMRALGLRRREQVVIHQDTPQIRGMIDKVSHLVKVLEGQP